jgi:eukaryotic-like serine/threonine-protein kinase
MTAFPAAGDYYKAVQAPARAFTVPKLQAAEFVWDSLGPTLARGSSAVVFQATVEGQPQALRCYIRNDASSRDRYSALDAYLAASDLSPYVSGATWLDAAIQVNRATWPVLTMDWIDGRTLNEYVDFLVSGSNAAALATLAARWRSLVTLLQSSEFTHGDLQHGNIMVDQEGQLRLVDFDGVWVPQLAGQSPPTEFGHPNYQHPGRHVWGRWLDTFSALVIYLSLVALSKDPGLWLALYNSKNLLFAKNDFFPPFKTEAWKQLAAMGDPQVDELARRLQECCDLDWVSDRSLEMTLDQRAVTPARPPIPVEQRWWEKRPAAADGAASAAAQAATARIAAGSLPAPPPLSAPLGLAGTGPMPQLSQTMAPPGATIWWSAPRSASAPGPPVAGQPAPGPAAPGPAAPAPPVLGAKPRPGPVAGAIALGLGIVLLIIGANSHVAIIVIGGLIAGAWGVWRLVTGTGSNAKPPGQA